MPRNGTPRSSASSTAPSRPVLRSAWAHRPNAPTPGRTTPDAPAASSAVGDEPGPRPQVDEGLVRRRQVADAVVEDGDSPVHRQFPLALPNVPLVDGTPPPSTRTASRRQRAVPLNDASTMWWVFFPVTRRRCSVMPDAVTKARQNSSASCGSNGGEPERRHVGSEGHVVGEVGATRDVEGHLHQRLVERQGDRREPADARLVPEGLGQGLAEHDAHVLDGVVGVDVEVPGGLDRSGRAPRAGRAGRACGRRTGSRSRPPPIRCRRGPARRRWPSPWSVVGGVAGAGRAHGTDRALAGSAPPSSFGVIEPPRLRAGRTGPDRAHPTALAAPPLLGRRPPLSGLRTPGSSAGRPGTGRSPRACPP